MKLCPSKEFDFLIHKKFYQDEFPLPDSNEFLSIDSAMDDKGIIINAGIRPIYELIILTDKDRTSLERKKAMDLLLAHVMKYKLDLHVFIQDKKWKNRVIKSFGFMPTKGEALILKVNQNG